jgi:hypothetical protein
MCSVVSERTTGGGGSAELAAGADTPTPNQPISIATAVRLRADLRRASTNARLLPLARRVMANLRIIRSALGTF